VDSRPHPRPAGAVVLTGAGGVLGWGLARRWPGSGLAPPVLLGRRAPAFWGPVRHEAMELGLGPRDRGSCADWARRLRPALWIHAASLSRWEACERDPLRAFTWNVEALRGLLEVARETGTRVLLVSTDQVFDGRGREYLEGADPCPVHVYGATKARAEDLALAAGQAVVRLPLLLGPSVAPGRRGADAAVVEAVRSGRRPRLFVDEWRTPLGVLRAAEGLLGWLADPQPGVFHLAGAEALSRLELGEKVCRRLGLRASFEALRRADAGMEQRPARLILRGPRAVRLLRWKPPDLRQSLAHWESRSHD